MRTILAALVGAVVLFVLGFVMWIGLDYHWKVMSPLPNEEKLVGELKVGLGRSGVYITPAPPHSPDGGAPTEAQMQQFEARHKSGPIAMIFWRAEGATPMDPKIFLKGFALNFIAALCAAMVARFAAVAGAGFGRRWAAVMLMAMFACATGVMTSATYWYWPDGYALVGVIDLMVPWALAGAIIAAMVK